MSASLRLCTFRLEGGLYGLDIEDVLEVVRRPPVTPVPLAPEAVRGLINLRGQILPVVDPRLCLGLEPAKCVPPLVVVVGGAEGQTGLLVDEVGDVLEADPTRFEPPPAAAIRRSGDTVRGIHKLDDTLLLALELGRLLQRAHANPGAGTSALHENPNPSAAARGAASREG